jgi:hypothetical protein
MKQQEVFKKIGVIIKELNDQYEYLKTVDGPLNELELELFLANSHFLGDHVVILSKLNAQNIAPKKTEEKQEEKPVEHHTLNFFEPLVQAPANFNKPTEKLKPFIEDTPVPEIDLGGSGEDTYAFIPEEEPETIRHELILDEADWDDEDDEQKDISDEEIEIPPVPEVKAREKEIIHEPEVIAVEKEIPIEEVKPIEKEVEIPVVAEVIAKEPEPESIIVTPVAEKAKAPEKDEVLTINERMSAKMAESRNVTEQVYGDKIPDLKKAITLNEKLLYIKDLFNGYSLAYSEAIEILNRFTSLNEADLFLKKNYVVKNNWDAKPETTAKLYALLQRRYA